MATSEMFPWLILAFIICNNRTAGKAQGTIFFLFSATITEISQPTALGEKVIESRSARTAAPEVNQKE